MKKIMLILIILLQLAAANKISASELLVIKALHYLDVASGKLISPAVILIQDDKIKAINPDAKVLRGNLRHRLLEKPYTRAMLAQSLYEVLRLEAE